MDYDCLRLSNVIFTPSNLFSFVNFITCIINLFIFVERCSLVNDRKSDKD